MENYGNSCHKLNVQGKTRDLGLSLCHFGYMNYDNE